jgi:hypothetical protein
MTRPVSAGRGCSGGWAPCCCVLGRRAARARAGAAAAAAGRRGGRAGGRGGRARAGGAAPARAAAGAGADGRRARRRPEAARGGQEARCGRAGRPGARPGPPRVSRAGPERSRGCAGKNEGGPRAFKPGSLLDSGANRSAAPRMRRRALAPEPEDVQCHLAQQLQRAGPAAAGARRACPRRAWPRWTAARTPRRCCVLCATCGLRCPAGAGTARRCWRRRPRLRPRPPTPGRTRPARCRSRASPPGCSVARTPGRPTLPLGVYSTM